MISTLRQMGRADVLTAAEQEDAVLGFVTDIQPFLVIMVNSWLTREAWELARDLGERHTYDSVYLAIARAFDMEFWTADQALLRRLDGRVPRARFLGDYPLP